MVWIQNRCKLVVALISVTFLLLLATGMLGQVSNQIELVSISSTGVQGGQAAAVSGDGRLVAFWSSSSLVPDDTNSFPDVFVRDRQTGEMTRISAASSSYNPSMSIDGQYIAFQSTAALVPDDTNGRSDVFIYERQTGETTRVSVTTNGTQGNHDSYVPSISADGRYVAFLSYASNLTGGTSPPPSGPNIFVHDRQTATTELVSGSNPGLPTTSYGEWASISNDGRFIAFQSGAILTSGDTNNAQDVYLRDRIGGVTERVSVSSTGAQGNSRSGLPAISGNGRFVAFFSNATNLVPNDTNGIPDIFVHDHESGATERVSVSSAGVQANQESTYPAISGDGRFVVFVSAATNLVPGDTNGFDDIFVHDRVSDLTERVSLSSAGVQATKDSAYPAISDDGRFVAFESTASNLIPPTLLYARNVFVALNTLYTPSEPTITNVSFDEQQVYDSTKWDPVGQDTVDGNLVRINVSIYNPTSSPQALEVQFTEGEGDTLLSIFDAFTSLPFANSTATLIAQPGNNFLPVFWDTNGYAWDNDYHAHSDRLVKVSLKLEGTEIDSETVPIKVIPKPIIFVHGADSNASTWTEFKNRVTNYNSDWRSFAVGDIPNKPSMTMNTGDHWHPQTRAKHISENSEAMAAYIRTIRLQTGAAHVDIIAHSMGGLISRYYIQNLMETLIVPGVSKPIVSHLMMLGTPNWGSPCAEALAGWGFIQPVSNELTPGYLREDFNRKNTNQRGVPFYVLAGNLYDDYTCTSLNGGDGVVEVVSALTGIDLDCRMLVPERGHLGMTNGQDFIEYIIPRLALGPRDAVQSPGCGASSTNSFNTPPPPNETIVRTTVRTLNIAAGQSTSIDIPVMGGYELGVEVSISPIISILLDPTNVVRSTIDNSSDQFGLPIRTHRIGNPAVGTWKIQITNPASSTAMVGVVAYLRGDPVEFKLDTGESPSPMPALAQPNPVPKPLVATLTENDVPIINATVTAEFTNYNGAKTTRSLTHQGDGVYGLQNPNLAPGTYWVNLTATTPNWMRILVTIWIVEPDIGPILSYYTTLTPTLTWNRISWAQSYELQVDDSANFALPLEYSATVSGLQETTSQLAHGVHYWRVRACSAPNTCGAWSKPEIFEVDTP